MTYQMAFLRDLWETLVFFSLCFIRETGRRDRVRETIVYPIEKREKEGPAWTPPSYREDQIDVGASVI